MIIIKKAKNKEWYFIVKSRNGRVLVRSTDTYKRRGSALKAIHSLEKAMTKRLIK